MLVVVYSRLPNCDWELFACLVLESAGEATLLAAAEQAGSGGTNTVLLTRLGGGAFGKTDDWINSAVERALCQRRPNGKGICLGKLATIDYRSLEVEMRNAG
jgi:hypothetical protein